jgi:hypothetical protein
MGMFFHLYSFLFSIRPLSMCQYFSAQNECSTFSFPAFPEMDSGIRCPQTPKMHPKLSAPKVMRQGMHVLYRNQIRRPARVSSRQCVHRRTSLRAAASRERFQMLGNNYSTSQHPFIASAASIQKGKFTTWLRLPRA